MDIYISIWFIYMYEYLMIEMVDKKFRIFVII